MNCVCPFISLGSYFRSFISFRDSLLFLFWSRVSLYPHYTCNGWMSYHRTSKSGGGCWVLFTLIKVQKVRRKGTCTPQCRAWPRTGSGFSGHLISGSLFGGTKFVGLTACGRFFGVRLTNLLTFFYRWPQSHHHITPPSVQDPNPETWVLVPFKHCSIVCIHLEYLSSDCARCLCRTCPNLYPPPIITLSLLWIECTQHFFIIAPLLLD